MLAALFPALASCFAVAGLLQPPDAPALHRRASRPALLAAADSTSALVSTLQNAAARRGEVVVVKFGGHAMSSDELSAQFANDMMVLQRLGLRPVVVHGGGPQINKMLDAVGVKSTFVDGLRVTSPEVMEIAEMVLCGSLNKKIASSINLAGGRAIGLSGKDDTLVSATRKLEPDLGLVGVPSAVRTELLLELLDKGGAPLPNPVHEPQPCAQRGRPLAAPTLPMPPKPRRSHPRHRADRDGRGRRHLQRERGHHGRVHRGRARRGHPAAADRRGGRARRPAAGRQAHTAADDDRGAQADDGRHGVWRDDPQDPHRHRGRRVRTATPSDRAARRRGLMSVGTSP